MPQSENFLISPIRVNKRIPVGQWQPRHTAIRTRNSPTAWGLVRIFIPSRPLSVWLFFPFFSRFSFSHPSPFVRVEEVGVGPASRDSKKSQIKNAAHLSSVARGWSSLCEEEQIGRKIEARDKNLLPILYLCIHACMLSIMLCII